MEILHVSAECYPVAKAGGLGDVVGALPKYQKEAGHIAKVVMPMYKTKFLFNNEFEVVHKGYTNLGNCGLFIPSSRKNITGSVSICIWWILTGCLTGIRFTVTMMIQKDSLPFRLLSLTGWPPGNINLMWFMYTITRQL